MRTKLHTYNHTHAQQLSTHNYNCTRTHAHTLHSYLVQLVSLVLDLSISTRILLLEQRFLDVHVLLFGGWRGM
jgi:hypothetical protein